MSQQSEMPAVAHVSDGVIVELLYDPDVRATSFAVARDGIISVEERAALSTGELLVPYSGENNLIARQCVHLPSQPVPSGTESELVEDISRYLSRYVEFTPEFERIAAYYVLLSWVHDAFNEVPYLRVRGDFGTGKTRALLAIGSIAYRGFFASGASTVSPIFHTLDAFGGTLVLDEADLRFSDKTTDLVKILNNGTVKGMPVLRTLQNRNKEFNPAAFRVFGPKIIAMRGSFRDIALESRFITENMPRRTLGPDTPIQLPNSLREEARILRNRLLNFRLKKLFSIRPRLDRQIAGIDPRLNQTALPLLSLVEDESVRQEIANRLNREQQVLEIARQDTVDARTLAAYKVAFAETLRTAIPLKEITVRANAAPGRILSAREIGQALREHAIPLRKSHGTIVALRKAVLP